MTSCNSTIVEKMKNKDKLEEEDEEENTNLTEVEMIVKGEGLIRRSTEPNAQEHHEQEHS